MTGNIICTGNAAADIAAIRASYNAGGLTTVHGKIVAPETRMLLGTPGIGAPDRFTKGIARLQGGVYELAGIDVQGRNNALSDVELLAYGDGIRKVGSILFRLSDSYIASHGNAIVLDTIAGTWVRDNHLNAEGNWQTSGTAGIKIGDSATGYEAADIVGNLVERYYTAFRIGGTGNCVNIRFSGNRTDRPASAHYLFAPQVTAGVRNVIIDEYWMNGGVYSIALSVAETKGRIDRIEVGGGHVLGTTNPNVTLMGDLSRIDCRVGALVVGPLEPG